MKSIFMKKGIFDGYAVILRDKFVGINLDATSVYGTSKFRTFSAKEFESYSHQWQEEFLCKAVSDGLAYHLAIEAIAQFKDGKIDKTAMAKRAIETIGMLPQKFFQTPKAVRILHDTVTDALIEQINDVKYLSTWEKYCEKTDIMKLWELNKICHEEIQKMAEKENLPQPAEKVL